MTRYGNRGQGLEKMIEASNNQYLFQELATIQKIPTPVKVLDIDSKTGKIRNGFYEQKSTVDYTGVFKGKAICFDAKETKIETRFDLKNLKDHQYNHLKNWHESGGISFLLVHFKSQDEFYYLPFNKLREYEGYYNNKWNYQGRKSIPYKEFEEKWIIESNGLVLIDYLSKLEELGVI